MPRVSIVIPTYNEAKNIPLLFEELFDVCRAANIDAEAIVVDDGSPDGTGAVAESFSGTYPVRVIHRSGKMGLGSAVRAGFLAANGEIWGVMDADLSHDPSILPKLILSLQEADISVGSRFQQGSTVENWKAYRRILSEIGVALARRLTKCSDPLSGYFFFKKNVLDGVDLTVNGYKILLEILVKGKYRNIKEISFNFRMRKFSSSKLNFKEYLSFLWQLIKYTVNIVCMKNFFLSFVKFFTSIIPASFFIYLYIFLCKNSFLKKHIHAVIIRILPDEVVLPEGVLLLNKQDPVVSGAVSFGVYEKVESALLREAVKPGMTVLDIGANIGYYTLIFARLVGPSGRVYAFEPDPINFEYLQKTIQRNGFTNVELFNNALGDKDGEAFLYLSESNKGDHRMYNVKNEKREQIGIRINKLDTVFEKKDISIDIIKMDVQGAEGMVLDGAEKIIESNPSMVMYTEFWPEGLKNSGSDPRKVFSLLKDRFDMYEIIEKDGKVIKIQDRDLFIKKYSGRKYANIICRPIKK